MQRKLKNMRGPKSCPGKFSRRGVLIGVLVFAAIASAQLARVSWFTDTVLEGKNFSAAAFLSSFWERVVAPAAALPGKIFPGLSGTPSPGSDSASEVWTLVSTGCYPPTTPKPEKSDADSRYGSLIISPVVSTASPDNVIRATVTPNFSPTRITLSIGHMLPEDIIDWGPKNLTGGTFVKTSGKLGWYANKGELLPEKVPYSLTLRGKRQSVPARVPPNDTYNTEPYNTFWNSMAYNIVNADQGASLGHRAYLINGPQTPRLFLDVPQQIVVEPNGAFEVKARSKWQAGTITLESASSAAKVLGEKTAQAQANEVKTWRVQPLYSEENKIDLVARLANSCGKDVAYADAIKVQYDFSKLTPEKVDIRMEQSSPITFGASNQSGAGITLYTKPPTKLGVPNITFTVRAVYADKRDTTAQNVLLSSSSGKTWHAGETATKTNSFGLAPLLVKAPKITPEEAKRKIILIAQTNDIKGIRVETPFGIRITPPVSSTPVKSVAIMADRSLEGIKEGDKIHFKALSTLSDGSQKTLTRGITWTVVGNTGSIDATGTFTAKLDASVAELGEALGVVTAVYTDADGEVFLGKTPTFKVSASASEESSPAT